MLGESEKTCSEWTEMRKLIISSDTSRKTMFKRMRAYNALDSAEWTQEEKYTKLQAAFDAISEEEVLKFSSAFVQLYNWAKVNLELCTTVRDAGLSPELLFTMFGIKA
mmetsp:Transcript_20916/g.54016  ORF Transcript_20916/g.54016 Transcript_20916/m.54016 type:complete len:108 (+) Transcript_20916:2981-3304(+)